MDSEGAQGSNPEANIINIGPILTQLASLVDPSDLPYDESKSEIKSKKKRSKHKSRNAVQELQELVASVVQPEDKDLIRIHTNSAGSNTSTSITTELEQTVELMKNLQTKEVVDKPKKVRKGKKTRFVDKVDNGAMCVNGIQEVKGLAKIENLLEDESKKINQRELQQLKSPKRLKPFFADNQKVAANAVQEPQKYVSNVVQPVNNDLIKNHSNSVVNNASTSISTEQGQSEVLVKNLETEGGAEKPKKVKKRKKKRPEDKVDDGAMCVNVLQEVKGSEIENVLKDKSTKINQRKIQQVKSPPEPFFADNKKAAAKRKSNSRKKTENEVFEPYLTAEEVEKGLADKTMVAGAIRINTRCYKEAYISSEGCEKDIMIEGLKNRNRALDGDEVVVLINPPEAWKVNSGQRTGKVVYIELQVHPRTCIGKLPSVTDQVSSYIVFSPRDSRIPRIKISLADKLLPPGYLKDPAAYAEILFYTRITAWNEVGFAQGEIMEEVGRSGDLEVETLAILLENNLDPKPINSKLNLFFPRLPFTIPENEISKRLDLRKECIFTIDPLTARDLDDAVSVRKLDNGNVVVGVHISDVSHFLHPNTLLDETVSKRATTVYLVQRVYHMLPVELCQMCSLTPGEDKLAFSVFIELTPDAQVVSHRFARSVIQSCVKFAYEHAQAVIDNPEKTFTSEDFPEMYNGFTAEDCAATVRELYRLSVIMRKRRFDTGALRIDQPKLCFHLDADSQTPLSSFIYENKESHRLIEEFMLLANITVAEHIDAAFPTLAFLRHHLPPRLNMMVDLQKKMEKCGVNLDITDAGTMHSSMAKYNCQLPDEDPILSWARHIVLNQLCAKPMLRANYFCPTEDCQEKHHYALNVPCYTHFTSPIRRYADVMVHRLLAASLDIGPQPSWSPKDIKRIANICNRQKQAAKVAGEQSSLLFLALYLREPVESMAAVIDVKDRSLDVIVRDFGIQLRVYTDQLPVTVQFINEDNMPQMYLQWNKNGPVQLIQLFSVVRVLVSCAEGSLKVTATLLPPLSS